MTRQQFRVLYREFLFRVVEVELLSPQADTGKLLGQLGGILGIFSLVMSLGAFFFDDRTLSREVMLIRAWGIEQFLISTTMLVVGLFAVLSWDSIFPSRQDIFILAPLPVGTRTLLAAKLAAIASALTFAIVVLNVFSGVSWPLVLSVGNWWLLSFLHTFAAYWITMFAAGAFVFCCVLAVEGVTAQLLPYWLFQRVSALLQTVAFALLLSLYFLEPHLATPGALTAPGNQRLLHWLPSYWFLALFQLLNGSMHPLLFPLTRLAGMGLVFAVVISAVAFLLSYYRTIRKLVEEPEIAPGSFGVSWLFGMGKSLRSAVVQFSARSLLRSRQHRAVLCFYVGVAFAISIFYLKTGLGQQAIHGSSAESAWWRQPDVPLLVTSVLLMSMMVVGTRVAFAMPLELKANWIFRIMPPATISDCVRGVRRSLMLLAVLPVWTSFAILFTWLWPWQAAAAHLILLALFGTLLVDICLYGFRKIPFTCSYLPGKSNVYVAFWIYVFLAIPLLDRAVRFEVRRLHGLTASLPIILALAAAAALVRWMTKRAQSSEESLQFEEVPASVLFTLDLHKDGVLYKP